MELFLLRHAIAVEREDFKGDDDSERPLTNEGKKKMQRVAKGMRSLGCSFDLILSSPYVRTRDTAEIVAGVFKVPRRLKMTDLLKPDGKPRALVHHLAARRAPRAVLLVGHEPYLSSLLATLIGARAPKLLQMKKGGLCFLNIEKLRFGPCAKLEWLLAPRQLAQMAR